MDETNRRFKGIGMMTNEEFSRLIDTALDIADSLEEEEIFEELDEMVREEGFNINTLSKEEIFLINSSYKTLIDRIENQDEFDYTLGFIEEDIINEYKELYSKFKESTNA